MSLMMLTAMSLYSDEVNTNVASCTSLPSSNATSTDASVAASFPL